MLLLLDVVENPRSVLLPRIHSTVWVPNRASVWWEARERPDREHERHAESRRSRRDDRHGTESPAAAPVMFNGGLQSEV